MVVKIYISGISGNKEVKKRQQRVLMILDSKNIKYEVIDITEPGRESDKDFMQNNAKSNGGTVSDPNPRSPLPPQLFNDEDYCGDYDQFDLANEVDTLEQFLKVEVPSEEPSQVENEKQQTLNGDISKSKETSQDREVTDDKVEEIHGASPKEGSPAKEGSPSKETVASKEPTPSPEIDNEAVKEGSPKEESPVKESSPERQKSVEKEATPEKEKSPAKESEVVSKEPSKENSPEKEGTINENGAVSSREQSEEKEAGGDHVEVADRKKDSSELLIQSEQAAASE